MVKLTVDQNRVLLLVLDSRSSNFSTREPTVGHNELESVEMESGTNTNTSNSNTTDTITNQKC